MGDPGEKEKGKLVIPSPEEKKKGTKSSRKETIVRQEEREIHVFPGRLSLGKKS